MAQLMKGGRYVVVTRQEYEDWLEMLDEVYGITYTFNPSYNRSNMSVTIQLRETVTMEIKGRALYKRAGQWFYGRGDNFTHVRFYVYPGQNYHSFGKGSRKLWLDDPYNYEEPFSYLTNLISSKHDFQGETKVVLVDKL